MSEVDTTLSSAQMPTLDVPESGGVLLRQAREASGFSVPALAAVLKVSTAKLDALEAGRWDLLPDMVFARALAASVCRALQIEVEPVLARFPSLATPNMKMDAAGINAPFRVPGEGGGLAWMTQLRRPGTLAVLVLIFGAVGLFMLPVDAIKSSMDTLQAAPIDTLTSSASTEIGPTPVALNNLVSESDIRQPSTDASVSPPSPTSIEKNSVSPLPLTVGGSGALAGTVVLKATGASWVEVVDGKGVLQARKTMAEGEVLGISGETPLSVVIGRADVVAVEIRGKILNTAQLTKNNIARFEVK
jgi:cytoskeleton protein RodZ